jgi:sec-independent protein translocase protein TatA
MAGLGAPELIVILLVVLLLFGSTKLPKLAKSLGEAQREFKKGIADAEAESAKPAPAAAVPVEEKVTLTRAELDALLAEREAQVRKTPPPAV